jgi:hypothetical protein
MKRNGQYGTDYVSYNIDGLLLFVRICSREIFEDCHVNLTDRKKENTHNVRETRVFTRVSHKLGFFLQGPARRCGRLRPPFIPSLSPNFISVLGVGDSRTLLPHHRARKGGVEADYGTNPTHEPTETRSSSYGNQRRPYSS